MNFRSVFLTLIAAAALALGVWRFWIFSDALSSRDALNIRENGSISSTNGRFDSEIDKPTRSAYWFLTSDGKRIPLGCHAIGPITSVAPVNECLSGVYISDSVDLNVKYISIYYDHNGGLPDRVILEIKNGDELLYKIVPKHEAERVR